MCRSDWLDKTERKYKKPPAEIAEDEVSSKIHKALKGQLSCTTREWIKAKAKEIYL